MPSIKTAVFYCGILFSTPSLTQQVDSLQIVTVIDQMISDAEQLFNIRNYEEADQILEKALVLSQEKFGEGSQAYAKCLHVLGKGYFLNTDYVRAEQSWLRVKSIREKVLGKESPDYLAVLNNLGVLYRQTGRYPEAESMFLETIQLKKMSLGPQHLSYANSVNTLGTLYTFMGEPQKAEGYLLEAKKIRESQLEPTHSDYTQSLNSLGNLYYTSGQFKKAEPLFLQAIDLCPDQNGLPSFSRIVPTTNLATLYIAMGEYAKAEHCYQQCTTYFQKLDMNNHPNYAVVLHNLARLYEKTGQFEEAKNTLLKVVDIRKEKLGVAHPEYAKALNNLGVIYYYLQEFQRAEDTYLAASVVYEQNQHFDQTYFEVKANQALLHLERRQYSEAEEYLLQARSIIEKNLGSNHYEFAKTQFHLGNVYYRSGRYEEAEVSLLSAKDLQQDILGIRHPEFATTLQSLAKVCWKLGKIDQTRDYLEEANLISRQLLTQTAAHLSAKELSNYSVLFDKVNDLFYSFMLDEDHSFAAEAYDQLLFQKGFLLHARQQIRQLSESNDHLSAKAEILQSMHYRLAEQYSRPLDQQINLQIIEQSIDSLEKELIKSVTGFEHVTRQISWQEIRASLNPGEVVIDFVNYRISNPDPTDSVVYGAFIMRPEWEKPRYITLGEEEQLFGLLKGTSSTVNSLAKNDFNEANQIALYHLIWHPLEAYLQDVVQIYLSPSGWLHRIPISSIQLPNSEIIGSRYRIRQLGSSRQLNNGQPGYLKKKSSSAVVMGGLYYHLDSSIIAWSHQSTGDALLKEHIYLSAVRSATQDSEQSNGWDYLPWTEVEAKSISAICHQSGLAVKTYLGAFGTEDNFRMTDRDSVSPVILHVATHGYFAPDVKENHKFNFGLDKNGLVFKLSDNPMIRSGLIMAGANHVWTGGEPIENLEDGILTAYEVSQMNLSETELVVLSACETGLGDIKGNEGVYGLQRAFKLAGVKYIVMSLWQVPDFATQELMTVFYNLWLKEGKDLPEAFRQAQLTIRAKRPDPFYWAGFVLVE